MDNLIVSDVDTAVARSPTIPIDEYVSDHPRRLDLYGVLLYTFEKNLSAAMQAPVRSVVLWFDFRKHTYFREHRDEKMDTIDADSFHHCLVVEWSTNPGQGVYPYLLS